MVNFEEGIIHKIKYQQKHKIKCEAVNPELPYKNPPALYVSQDELIPEFTNMLNVNISILGDDSLILKPWLGGFNNLKNLDPLKLSYLRFDFSDFVAQEFQHLMKAKLKHQLKDGTFKSVPGKFIRCSKTLEKEGFITELYDSESEENSVWIFVLELKEGKKKDDLNKLMESTGLMNDKGSNFYENNKLDIDPLSDGLILKKDEALVVEFDSIVTFVRPSLRYLDVSWKESNENSNRILTQCPIITQRPSYFVEPPFPLNIFWLNNHNVAYISKSDNAESIELDNELSFAIVNKGLLPLQLDCRDDILEQPYFELMFLGGDDTGDITAKKYLKDIQLEIDDDTYGDKWTHHKMIQGPTITWRIQPRLYINGRRNKSILGVQEHGIITFNIKNLRVYGKPGVSMIFLKYYNIPDFDDNQIALNIEKRDLSGSIPSGGFKENILQVQTQEQNGKILNPKRQNFTPPLRWKVKPTDGNLETHVLLGNKVGIGSENLPESTLDVNGQLSVRGNAIIFSDIEIKGKMKSNIEVEKSLKVGADIEIKGRMKSNVEVEKNMKVGSDLNVNGKLTVGSLKSNNDIRFGEAFKKQTSGKKNTIVSSGCHMQSITLYPNTEGDFNHTILKVGERYYTKFSMSLKIYCIGFNCAMAEYFLYKGWGNGVGCKLIHQSSHNEKEIKFKDGIVKHIDKDFHFIISVSNNSFESVLLINSFTNTTSGNYPQLIR